MQCDIWWVQLFNTTIYPKKIQNYNGDEKWRKQMERFLIFWWYFNKAVKIISIDGNVEIVESDVRFKFRSFHFMCAKKEVDRVWPLKYEQSHWPVLFCCEILQIHFGNQAQRQHLWVLNHELDVTHQKGRVRASPICQQEFAKFIPF
jgi:hypothetical protein